MIKEGDKLMLPGKDRVMGMEVSSSPKCRIQVQAFSGLPSSPPHRPAAHGM